MLFALARQLLDKTAELLVAQTGPSKHFVVREDQAWPELRDGTKLLIAPSQYTVASAAQIISPYEDVASARQVRVALIADKLFTWWQSAELCSLLSCPNGS